MIRRLSLPILGLALLTFLACDGSQQPAEADLDVDGAAAKPILTHKDGAEHGKPGKDDEAESYSVVVEGAISGSDVGTAAAREQILINDFALDLTFFRGKLNCEITGQQSGAFTLNKGSEKAGDNAFILYQFSYNGIRHSLDLDGAISDLDNWLPSGTGNSITERPPGNGQWKMTASGKNHQNGCTGEGDGLVYTATATPTS